MQKIQSLESLRGFAALIVVAAHLAFAFFPAMVVGESSAISHSSYESIILQSPLNFFINGHFAVICFFVLSGFVLSYGFFSKKKFDLVSAALRRYFRLAPIVLASVILSFLILKFGLYFNASASEITQSAWLDQFWKNDDITFIDALWSGLVGVFALQPTTASLNPLLWTIYFELIGSLIVYAVLALTGRDSRRWLVYTILLIVLSNTYFVGFVAGMILCDVYINKSSILQVLSTTKRGYKVFLLLAAIYLASFPAYIVSPVDVGVIHAPLQIFSESNLTKNILYVLASVIIISLLLTGSRLRKIFEKKPFVFLGSISYSLYATHLIVLGSFGSGFFLLVERVLPYNYAVGLTALALLAIVIGVATLFRKYVDEPSINLSRQIVPHSK